MIKLFISAGGARHEYSKYLDFKSIQITEKLNAPSQMTFSMTPIDYGFILPPQRSYVELFSTIADRSIFTGFISSEPSRNYRAKHLLGKQYKQLFTFSLSCVSDEHLLNIKSVPFIPAFVNRTQGQILAKIADILCPGFFDASEIADGDLVPFFEYKPTQSWSEIAKTFGDASRFRYKVRDKQISYQPYADGPLGIGYDEQFRSDMFIAPFDLKTNVVTIPIVNDVTVIGDTEAGSNREDYFLGDGFTGKFPLHHKVFRGATSVLLQESWNGNGLNTQNWFLQDPGVNYDFSAGALNLVQTDTAFDLGESYLSLNNGIELAGGINIQSGEFSFNDYCDGVLGGIYTDTTFAAASGTASGSLIAGFVADSTGGVTTGPSGAVGVNITPWWEGAAVAPAIVSAANHTYILQMIIHAPKFVRYSRKYRTIEGEEFGGTPDRITGSITWVIQDSDIAKAIDQFYEPDVTEVTKENVELPPFVVYALINNQKLNLTVTNTAVALMPLGGLQALTGPLGLARPTGSILPMLPDYHPDYMGSVVPWPSTASGNILPDPLPLGNVPHVLIMGSGFDRQAAQIIAGNSADELDFYLTSLPAAGTPIRLQTWEAQAATSRLQVTGSIADEAFIVGDDGIRSATVSDMNPLPRTSEDCDNAALAFLADASKVTYNGTYTCTSLFFKGVNADWAYWPTVGRFFNLNSPARGIPNDKFLVSSLGISVLEPSTELLQYQIGFGADLRLEKVLKHFVDIKHESVLTSTDKANPPTPRSTVQVHSTYLPDLHNVHLDLRSITVSTAIVRVDDSYYGPIEVRRIDANWGRGATRDLVGIFEGPEFLLERKAFDQVWYMRPVIDGITSRRSKVIRLRWPMKPSHPILQAAALIRGKGPDGLTDTYQLQFNFNGDVRSIYGFELRAADNSTVLVQCQALIGNMTIDLSKTPLLWLPAPLNTTLALYAYFFTAGWEYSDPMIVDAELLLGQKPYIWSPAAVAKYDGDVFAPDDTFSIKPVVKTTSDGVNMMEVEIRGNVPPNYISEIAGPPLITVELGTGGSIKAGTYVIGVTSQDSIDRTRRMSILSNLVKMEDVPDGSKFIVHVRYEGHTAGADVYMAMPNYDRGWHYQTHLSAGVTSIEVTEFFPSTAGAPDAPLHHFEVVHKKIWHSGIFGQQIGAVTSDSITIAGGVFDVDALAGRIVSLLAKFDTTIEVPVANFRITGNTVDTLQIGANGDGVSPPDLTTIFAVGDVVTVRYLMQDVGADTWSDPMMQNCFYPDGATADEQGRFVWIIDGKGKGQVKPIVDNTATSYVIGSPWDELPDETSIPIIVEADWHPASRGQQFVTANKASFTGLVLTTDFTNLENTTWAFRVFTSNQDNAYTDNPWVRMRELFVFGAPETTRTVTADYTQQFSDMNIWVDTTDGPVVIQLLSYQQFPGRPLFIKKVSADSNTVTVLPVDGENIEGEDSWVGSAQWDLLHIQSNVARDAV